MLVFEDLHWGDEELLDFVDDLAEWAADVPIAVIGTARPQLLTDDELGEEGEAQHDHALVVPLSNWRSAR